MNRALLLALTSSLERAGHSDASKALKNDLYRDQEGKEEVEGRPEEAMTGDATLVESTSGDLTLDLQTPADGSQASLSGKSPVKAGMDKLAASRSASPVKRLSTLPVKVVVPAVETVDNDPEDEEEGDKADADSIFGDDDDGSVADVQNEETGDHEVKEDGDVDMEDRDAGDMPQSKKSPDQKARSDVDLGYLYTVSL